MYSISPVDMENDEVVSCKVHRLKIKSEYAKEKLAGKKPFEIRFNDRNFKVGDLVKYICEDDMFINLQLFDKTYRIEYITDYQQKDGYIVYSESQCLIR